MKAKPTVFAALHRPFRFRFSEGMDVLRDTVNRITGSRFTSTRTGVDLLRSIPAIRIAPHRIYMDARLHLGVDQPLKLVAFDELLAAQTKLTHALLEGETTKLKRLAELQSTRQRPKAQPPDPQTRLLTRMLGAVALLFAALIILLALINA